MPAPVLPALEKNKADANKSLPSKVRASDATVFNKKTYLMSANSINEADAIEAKSADLSILLFAKISEFMASKDLMTRDVRKNVQNFIQKAVVTQSETKHALELSVISFIVFTCLR